MQGRKSTLTALIAVGLMAGSAVAVAAQEADRAVSVERLCGQLEQGMSGARC